MMYTIGHSNINQESFIQILVLFKIQLLVDIRSSPYSKFVPHFNRENLKTALKDHNIKYMFLGDKIGGKPKYKKYYQNGKVNYDLIAKSQSYKDGINKIIEFKSGEDIVLMCSEEDPYNCHRHNLITQTLVKKGLEVVHIRKDNKIDRITEVSKKDVQTTLF